ncbi:MAG: glycosyltransferase family 4 protein, partial [Pseudomonadota bacterium]
VHMKPFIEVRGVAEKQERLPNRRCELVTVAMMRPGDKLASYQLLGEALSRLEETPWRLTIIGDGSARSKVEKVLPPSDRIRYRGKLPAEEIQDTLHQSDLFVWPAIREAYGMALLEAQAAGVPVIAGASGGVPDIVVKGLTGLLPPEGDTEAFTRAMAKLLIERDLLNRMGEAARVNVERHHSLSGAARALDGWLTEAVEETAP